MTGAYEAAWHIRCPHCHAYPYRHCVTDDGYERRIPCVNRTRAAGVTTSLQEHTESPTQRDITEPLHTPGEIE